MAPLGYITFLLSTLYRYLDISLSHSATIHYIKLFSVLYLSYDFLNTCSPTRYHHTYHCFPRWCVHLFAVGKLMKIRGPPPSCTFQNPTYSLPPPPLLSDCCNYYGVSAYRNYWFFPLSFLSYSLFNSLFSELTHSLTYVSRQTFYSVEYFFSTFFPPGSWLFISKY